MVAECRRLLSNVILQEHGLDQWLWQLDPVGGYFVRGACQFLTSNENPIVGVASYLI